MYHAMSQKMLNKPSRVANMWIILYASLSYKSYYQIMCLDVKNLVCVMKCIRKCHEKAL